MFSAQVIFVPPGLVFELSSGINVRLHERSTTHLDGGLWAVVTRDGVARAWRLSDRFGFPVN